LLKNVFLLDSARHSSIPGVVRPAESIIRHKRIPISGSIAKLKIQAISTSAGAPENTHEFDPLPLLYPRTTKQIHRPIMKAIEEKRNPKVDGYFRREKKWHDELEKLRAIALGCQLTEEVKWGVPCYTFQDRNLVLIHVFKEYCALLFFKGALLKDARGILVQQTKNVQAARQVRFTSVREIVKLEPVLKAYVKEAIEVEKAGLKVSFKKTTEFKIPEEFQRALDKKPALKTAFYALTPGRQRAYILYFSAPKQSKTRESRVEKCMQQILKGKGLDDE
jgi:uncharacterized protein YdeI (YjbR/CyaY-like superfamily)